MNKFLSSLILVILTFFICSAQNEELAHFVPDGYVMFEKYHGDLNKDEVEDCVLIIKKIDSSKVVINRFNKEVDRNRRGIVVLINIGDSYQLIDKNYDCFLSENEDGGIYFQAQLSVDFKRGNLILHYGHGRYGFWEYIFRLQDSSFKLIGYESSSYYGPVVDQETSINFLTKKKLVRKNTNDNATGGDEVFKETWHNIEIENLINLSAIKDFDQLNIHGY